MSILGRDWRLALHPSPLCDECAELADVMLWHQEALPWRLLCSECLVNYRKKCPKRKMTTRLVRNE
jgi:hypothetical protein